MQKIKFDEVTIALAGITQAVALVRELAQTGKVDETAFQASIHSLFQTEPSHISDVYGDLAGIKVGLQTIINLMDPTFRSPRPQTRYMLSLIHVQKKISRSPEVLDNLTRRIGQVRKQVDYFFLTHPTVITNLADIYLSTISNFKFKIIIWGNQRILGVSDNIDKIRALLLAGIRSAVLWRQMGGSRLHLLFSRTKVKTTAQNILNNLS